MTIFNFTVYRDAVGMDITIDQLLAMLAEYDDPNLRGSYEVAGYDESVNHVLLSKKLADGTRTYVNIQLKLLSEDDYVHIDHLWILNSWCEYASLQRANATATFGKHFPNHTLLAHNHVPFTFDYMCLYYEESIDVIHCVKIVTTTSRENETTVVVNSWRKAERFNF